MLVADSSEPESVGNVDCVVVVVDSGLGSVVNVVVGEDGGLAVVVVVVRRYRLLPI